MSKFKRTNRAQTTSMDVILVGKDDQNLATGSLVDGTTSLGIADGQLGVLSWDHDGVEPLGDFMTSASADVSKVSAIKILQGTPKSNAIHTVEPWEVSDKAYVESGIIHRDNIRSVTTDVFRVPVRSAFAVTDLPTIQEGSTYGTYLEIQSVRNDRDWSDNDEVVFESVDTPADMSAITNNEDYVLTHLGYKLNTRSKVVNLSNSASVRRGNKNYVVLAIDTDGGAGQAIGTITCAGTPTTFDIMKDYDAKGNATTTSITADASIVSALANLIQKQVDDEAAGTTITNQITTSSTIEVIDPKAAGDSAIDCLVVLGVPETKAAYRDNITQVQPTVKLNLSDSFRSAAFIETFVMPYEGQGSGSNWIVDSEDRYQLSVHTAQKQPHGEFFSKGVNYIDADSNYTSYIIEYFDYEDTLTIRQQTPARVKILLPASYTCNTVANAVTNLATGDAIPGATSDTTTVADLNAVLGAWLETARPYSSYQRLGSTATRATGTFTVTNNTNMATDTVTIGSTALVEGTDFDAGSDNTAAQLAVTATNLAAAINASGEAVTAVAEAAVVTVYANSVGTDGNSIVWTYTDQASAGGTISGSGTLTGGTDNFA